MASCDDGGRGWQSKKWTSVTAIIAVLLGIAVAAVFITGAQVANSPMATASTSKATPWVPRPQFAPKHAQSPKTSVDAQGETQGETGQAKANNPNANWLAKATPPFRKINEDMKSLYQTYSAQDVPGVKAACRGLSDAGQDLAATLPAPKDDLTAESQGVVDEIAALASTCLSDQPDANAMQDHATGVQTHMGNLAKLVNG